MSPVASGKAWLPFPHSLSPHASPGSDAMPCPVLHIHPQRVLFNHQTNVNESKQPSPKRNNGEEGGVWLGMGGKDGDKALSI